MTVEPHRKHNRRLDMVLIQERLEYKPITIVLETASEARGLLEIIDESELFDLTPQARKLVRKIDRAFMDSRVEIPVNRGSRCRP